MPRTIITGALYPGHEGSFLGPFAYGGSLYVVAVSASALNQVWLYGSSNGGSSWAAIVQLDVSSGANLHGMWAVLTGSVLRVSSGSTSSHATYDLATPGTAPVYVGVAGSNPDITGANPSYVGYRTTTSTPYVLVQGTPVVVMTTNYRRTALKNPTNSSSLSSDVAGLTTATAAHSDARAFFVDSSGNMWAFYTRTNLATTLYCKKIAAGGTALSAEIVVATIASSNLATVNYPVSNVVQYTNGANTFIVIAVASATNVVAYQANITGTTFASLGTVSGVAADRAASNPVSLVSRANLLEAYTVRSSDKALYRAAQSAVGGAFGAEAAFSTGVLGGVSAGAITGGAGVVYNVDGVTYYDAFPISPSAVTLRRRFTMMS